MDSEIAGAIAEATPAASAPEAFAGDPSAAPEVAAPVAPEPEPEWIEVTDPNTGRIYTRVRKDEVPHVMLEKDRYIAQLRQQLQQSVLPQPPPVDPVAARVAELEREIRADMPELDEDSVKILARTNAKSELRAEQAAYQRFVRDQQRQQVEAFVRANPELDTALGREVFERYRPNSPEAHLALVRMEMQQRGMAGLSPERQASVAGQIDARRAGIAQPRSAGGPAAATAAYTPNIVQAWEGWKNNRGTGGGYYKTPEQQRAALDEMQRDWNARTTAR